MRSLNGLSGRNLRRRPGRFALTGAGAALGVAVLYAVLVASGATNEALDREINGAAGKADVFIGPVGSYDAVLDPALLQRVKGTDGVAFARSSVVVRSAIKPLSDEADERSTRENIVFLVGEDLDTKGTIREVKVASGRLPKNKADEIVVPESLADELEAGVGDTVEVASPRGLDPMLISGILADRGAALSFQGGVAYTSLARGQELLGKGKVITGIDVVLADDRDADGWIDAHRDDLGSSLSMQNARDVAAGFRSFIGAVTGGLTLLSAIAIFVGGFLVFLTFSVAVAERTRMYGTLRALGARPRQVRRVVLAEAGALGLVASLIGLVIGQGLASASVGLTEALLGLDLPPLGLPVGPALVSLTVGVVVSLASAWLPSSRAAALSPVAAMRDAGSGVLERRIRVWPRVALVVVGLALVTTGPSVPLTSLGTLVLMLGSVLVVPIILRPVAGAVGRVTARASRGAGPVAVMHLVKERSRSAYTLGLVMVVLAMLIAIAGFNDAALNTIDDVLENQGGGNIQVGAPGAFEPEFAKQLEAMPGAGVASPARFGRTDWLVDDAVHPIEVMVLHPKTYFSIAGFAWVDGDDDSAEAALAKGGSVLLPDGLARGAGVERGESIEVRTGAGVKRFRVAGVYALIGNGFGIIAGTPDAKVFGAGRPNGFMVEVEDGVDAETLGDQIKAQLGADRALIVDTPQSTKEFAYGQLRGFTSLAFVILFVAAIAGLMGLANTLAVSVLARTREIGILRSNGARRRQIRAMVLVEATTLAAVAFVLAIPLGLALTIGTSGSFRDALGATIEVTMPWGTVIFLMIATLIVAGIAALIPARRAGRLEPVAALRFD